MDKIRACLNCGKEFEITNNKATTKKFCSEKCRYEYYRKTGRIRAYKRKFREKKKEKITYWYTRLTEKDFIDFLNHDVTSTNESLFKYIDSLRRAWENDHAFEIWGEEANNYYTIATNYKFYGVVEEDPLLAMQLSSLRLAVQMLHIDRLKGEDLNKMLNILAHAILGEIPKHVSEILYNKWGYYEKDR